MEKHAGYKRHIYFIEKSFQARFIARFCALIALGGLLTVAILYVLSLSSTTVAFVNSRVQALPTAQFILPLLIETALLVIAVISALGVVLTLLMSHKIAGPLFRFKKTLEALAQGDFSTQVHIRKNDQLHSLADEFEHMVKRLRDELHALKGNIHSLKEKMDNLPEHEVPEHRRAYLADLKKISSELARIINYFKT